MIPLFRFTNVDLVLVQNETGRSILSCNCLEIIKANDGYLLNLYDLFASASGVEIDPKILGSLQIAEKGDCTVEEPEEIAEVAFARILVGATVIMLIPREGELVRRDRWFAVDLPPAQEDVATAIRSVQLTLTCFERELREYPENDGFREQLGQLVGHLTDRLDRLEARLAQLQGSGS